MELKDIINQMEDGTAGQEKSASAPAAPANQQQSLDAALEKAAGAPPVQAEPVDAVAALMKTANELAGTEKEAEISHAAICGQAFADGAIAKFAAYDAQVQQAGVSKEASAEPQVDDELIKAAAEQGYKEAQEKLAGEYQAGHNEALQQVHDMAASEFIKGAAEVEVMVQMAEQAQR